jgi:hypothetical protein
LSSLKEATPASSSSDVSTERWTTASGKGIPNIGFSDHWSFWQEGFPALMVTDTAPFRYPYYHTPEDTVDKIDFEKTARVVRGLRAVIEALVGTELCRIG